MIKQLRLITRQELEAIKDAVGYGDQFEIGFINFLNKQGYPLEDLFETRHRIKINQYRNEFVKGWNFGYKEQYR